jgi:hypothetical protein
MEQSPFEKLTSQEIPRIFMEPESSLPYTQVPATRPYPEPAPSSPQNTISIVTWLQVVEPTDLGLTSNKGTIYFSCTKHTNKIHSPNNLPFNTWHE